MIRRNFSEALELLLETVRLAGKTRRAWALNELMLMAVRADYYFKDHPDSSPTLNAQSDLPVLVEQYCKVPKEQRADIQEKLSRIAYHADLTGTLEGAPTVSFGEAMAGAFDRRHEVWCPCCGRYAGEERVFCPSCERSDCKDSGRFRRWFLHSSRTLRSRVRERRPS